MIEPAVGHVPKSVGFDTPSIIVNPCDHESSDDDDDALGSKETSKLLNKALTYTRKSRFKSLVGDALQLTQMNRRASQDFSQGLLEKKTRRKSVMKQVLVKKVPKLSELMRTLEDKRTESCKGSWYTECKYCVCRKLEASSSQPYCTIRCLNVFLSKQFARFFEFNQARFSEKLLQDYSDRTSKV